MAGSEIGHPQAQGRSCKLVVKRVSTSWNNQLVLTLTIDSQVLRPRYFNWTYS